jgi:uncharacterized protein YceK
MKKLLLISILSVAVLSGCGQVTQNDKDSRASEQQQSQYAKSQPLPVYNWSLERHMVIELYNARNLRAATHSVWRSDLGSIEGDCASIGFGIPYDTSLTNPLSIEAKRFGGLGRMVDVVEQAEPNGIFASKNTAATWVMCAGDNGAMEPVYVETKVTVYPYPVKVDYDKNRVIKAGKSTVTISVN